MAFNGSRYRYNIKFSEADVFQCYDLCDTGMSVIQYIDELVKKKKVL